MPDGPVGDDNVMCAAGGRVSAMKGGFDAVSRGQRTRKVALFMR